MAHSTRRPSGGKSPSHRSGYTRTTPKAKPKKPAFPLWFHKGTGQWAKKIRGKRYYFGTDREAGLAEYMRTKDDLEAGRVPSPPDDQRVTLVRLVNAFLTHKTDQVQTGELASRTFELYHTSSERLLAHFGKTVQVDQLRPDSLLGYRHKLAETLGPTTLGNEITRVRSILRFAFENGLINQPIRFGEFKKPKRAGIRRARVAKGSRLFEAAELRRILETAPPTLKAMTLLGLNCGFGNTDCSTLPRSAVDLKTGWVDYPRPKTGAPRRCPLWPETVDAIRAALEARPHQYETIFVTEKGEPWANGRRGPIGITHEFRRLLDRLGLYRPGLSFYSLRHTFQTIGDETGDYLAVRRVMGHTDSSISDMYRERFPDERLIRVSEHVRQWLHGASE